MKLNVKNIVFDFNGTIIDDVDICLNLLNKMLEENNHKGNISKERYLQIFDFPIIEYYQRAGFDFSKDDFKSLSSQFDKEYREYFPNLKPFDDVVSFIKKYYQKYNLYILSATRQDLLIDEVKQLNLEKYFKGIIGINNIYAYSKLEAAKEFFKQHQLEFNSTLFIGDTIHDNQVAKELNSTSILISRGHQSIDVLKRCNANYIFNKMDQVEKLLN